MLGKDTHFLSAASGASQLNSEHHSLDLQGIRPTPEQGLALGLSESDFRLALNEDAMASEKLAEGIRAFCADTLKLEALLQA
jgi:transaldolase